MAQKLKIIPLGGLNEIGKNLTAYEYGRDIIVVDCGMGFPDDDMYGVDVVIPDVSYLVKNKSRIRGVFLTHGHEDHIGALPYVMDRINPPIYTTRLTAGLVQLKLQERGLLDKTKIVTVEAGETISAGCFKVEFIHVNHSIADSVAFAIKTPIGTVVQTGDFKIDVTPLQGEMTDLTRFGELGREGVLALLMDSTNVERPGHSLSESKVHDRFDQLFKDCDKRIIVTTFASNVDRIRQIIDLAVKYKRKVGITGRSMENVVKLCVELGYMKVPDGILVDMKRIGSVPRNKLVILSTGSQGESMSALYRMAFSEHKQVDIGSGDRVIISASAIPGNETTISRVIDELFAKGAEVIYERGTDLHVSGHACQEELKLIQALTKPKFFIPVHGEYKHLIKHAEIAKSMGMADDHIIIASIGDVIETDGNSMRIVSQVPAGRVMVDGLGVGDVGSIVLRDRKHLAQDGLIIVVIGIERAANAVVAGPDIISRGFVYVRESEELMDEARSVLTRVLDNCNARDLKEWGTLKTKLRDVLSDFIYEKTKRSPMILPIIMEV